MKLDPRQRALNWLQQYGVSPDSLLPMSGYTNHVFLVTQSDPAYPQLSVLRLADFSISAELCPLAHQFDVVLDKHVAAAELGLSPGVIAADKIVGAMWLEYAGQQREMESSEFAEVSLLLDRLHGSDLNGLDDEAYAGVQRSSLHSLLQNLLDELRNRITPGLSGGGHKRKSTPALLCKRREPCQQNQVVAGRPPLLAPHGLLYKRGSGEQGGFIAEQLETLIKQGQQRGYFQCPLVPIHGDMNPGNLLHDGQRWWLIDWDFSTMGIREWDMAGLIVEHGWNIERAQQFMSDMPLADMQWFCSCFALLSWHWHQQRGSQQDILASKWQTMQYWLALKR